MVSPSLRPDNGLISGAEAGGEREMSGFCGSLTPPGMDTGGKPNSKTADGNFNEKVRCRMA